LQPRRATVRRSTTETRIALTLNLDGAGKSSIATGIPFFDHMLTLFARHATMDVRLRCRGDLAVDGHHTVEDCGLALGQAFREALGGKLGIRRYGTGFDPRNPLPPKPTCRWMSAWPGVCLISAAGPIWSGAA
jgi:imidazoleglycerol-phosphate dehydratase